MLMNRSGIETQGIIINNTKLSMNSPDNFVLYNKKLYEIKKVFQIKSKNAIDVIFSCIEYSCLESIFKHPTDSRGMNIFKINNFQVDDNILYIDINLKDVDKKMIVLHLHESVYAFPMLHNIFKE